LGDRDSGGRKVGLEAEKRGDFVGFQVEVFAGKGEWTKKVRSAEK